jgi:hypothetical protein
MIEQTLSAHPLISAGDELPIIGELTGLIPRLLNFWLYQCRPLRPKGILHGAVNVLLFPTNFFLEPVSHHRQLIAYLRGVWDGLTGHIERRY